MQNLNPVLNLFIWFFPFQLTHWGRVTYICVGNLTVIGSGNDLSSARRQVIIWNNAEILLIGPLGINWSKILIEIHKFSFQKMHLKMSSATWQPFFLSLNVLNLILVSFSCDPNCKIMIKTKFCTYAKICCNCTNKNWITVKYYSYQIC